MGSKLLQQIVSWYWRPPWCSCIKWWIVWAHNPIKHTMTYFGIKPSGVLVTNVHHQNQGMDTGVVFRPISFKTLLGLNEHYPYGPYCNLKDGRNPIFAKVTGVVSRVLARSGTICIWTVYQCAQTLPISICLIWMQEAVPIGWQPQPWHNYIILTPQVTQDHHNLSQVGWV